MFHCDAGLPHSYLCFLQWVLYLPILIEDSSGWSLPILIESSSMVEWTSMVAMMTVFVQIQVGLLSGSSYDLVEGYSGKWTQWVAKLPALGISRSFFFNHSDIEHLLETQEKEGCQWERVKDDRVALILPSHKSFLEKSTYFWEEHRFSQNPFQEMERQTLLWFCFQE